MNNKNLVRGINGIDTIVAVHEITQMFGNSITLVTALKSGGEIANYEIKGKVDKPRVNNRYVAMLLEIHLCKGQCYPDIEGFTKVVETRDGSLDYAQEGMLPDDSKIYYIRKISYQPSNSESQHLY